MGKAGKAIEWAKWSWNPIKGMCPRGCKDLKGEVYCYMQAYYRRFKLDPTLRLDRKALQWNPPIDGLIFAGSSIDMFHPLIPSEWIQAVLDFITEHPFAEFAILTKTPERYAEFDLPANCLYGTTEDGTEKTQGGTYKLIEAVPRPGSRFVSFEPLLGITRAVLGAIRETSKPCRFVDWIVIGGDSRPGAEKPPDEWADALIDGAARLGIPVWLKDNYRYNERWGVWKEPPFSSDEMQRLSVPGNIHS